MGWPGWPPTLTWSAWPIFIKPGQWKLLFGGFPGHPTAPRRRLSPWLNCTTVVKLKRHNVGRLVCQLRPVYTRFGAGAPKELDVADVRLNRRS
ncbi:unnamed protein product [Macrosiphum euphorbiae]|uniref:Uncharacterized protein n=1 Tax=Macrosiphum euphorbiae TaxID=13131 RepID=A0AAV0XHM2_9HEMI|nr:unnamed protein product [Macrosiphum euphorbiae]